MSYVGLDYLKKINEYVLFEKDGNTVKRIKDKFFIDNKNLVLGELNPIWFNSIINKKTLVDKKIISLILFSKLNNSIELNDFFYDLFICQTNCKEITKSSKYFYNRIKINELYISSRYFYSVGLNI